MLLQTIRFTYLYPKIDQRPRTLFTTVLPENASLLLFSWMCDAFNEKEPAAALDACARSIDIPLGKKIEVSRGNLLHKQDLLFSFFSNYHSITKPGTLLSSDVCYSYEYFMLLNVIKYRVPMYDGSLIQSPKTRARTKKWQFSTSIRATPYKTLANFAFKDLNQFWSERSSFQPSERSSYIHPDVFIFDLARERKGARSWDRSHRYTISQRQYRNEIWFSLLTPAPNGED